VPFFRAPLPLLLMESLQTRPKGRKISVRSLKKKWPYAQLEISLHYEAATVMPTPFTDSDIAYDYFLKIWDMDTIDIQEDVVALYLNQRGQLIGHRRLSRGDTHSALFSQKIICAIGLLCLASGVILAHNHPSGSLTPSKADHRATGQLSRSLALLDIQLLDHLIITTDGYTSIPVPKQRPEISPYTPCVSTLSVY
jgi:DNA repair protein RadC